MKSGALGMNPLDFRPRCTDCKAPLTLEEAHYYEIRCQKCEGERHERLQRWKAGAPDAEFDKLFGE